MTKAATAVQPRQEEQLPAGLMEEMMEHADKGVSRAQQDNLVPLIYVLQANSPQVNRHRDDYIDGAQPGDIWMRNSSEPIVKGDVGFLFQPCYYWKEWVEWTPRDEGGGGGAGFRGRHPNRETDDPADPDVPDVADARSERDPDTGQMLWSRPNGNDLVLTRCYAGYALRDGAVPEPFIVPFTSTGHTTARKWMSKIGNKIAPNGRNVLPIFGFLYHLRTRFRRNAKGEWYVLDVDDAGMVRDVESLHRGAALHEAFKSGEKRGEAPVVQEGAAADPTAGGKI